ncbi:MAG: hypothetical protein EKK41_09020 [Hyphomicrobiales bacterium]|nr:MAG: hypothetical protein EKK41_09020 [Hyphomicrobiales bacterium]
MFALSNRPFRNAGLALYGLGSLASLGMISNQASAQTLAAASVARAEACAHLTIDPSPKGIEAYVACELREIDRRTKEHERRAEEARLRGTEAERRSVDGEKRAAAASREIGCQEILIGGIEKGRIKIDKVKAVYGERPPGSISACSVLDKLSKG